MVALESAPTASPDLWRLGFASLPKEHPSPVELEVEGRLPADLQGTLYRNGPGQTAIFGERLRHWFDGDGMIHALRLADGKVFYQNQFVHTRGKQAEDKAGKRLFAGFGETPAGGLWGYLRGLGHKNPANTNVIFHAEKLMALCEAGLPYRLDPQTLATLGEDNYDAVLAPHATFSAHPKLHVATGDMWNFGMAMGRQPSVRLYRCLADGTCERRGSVPMPFNGFVHDFALTATKAIFVFSPLKLPRLPLAFKFGLKSFDESLQWRPGDHTHVAVVDLATGAVVWGKTAALLTLHSANAWDDDDGVVLDICAYPDATTLQALGGVMRGQTPRTSVARLTRLLISDRGEVRRQSLGSVGLEFPRVSPGALTREHRVVFGAAWDAAAPTLAAIPARLDVITQQTTLAPMAPGEYCGECVPVKKAGIHDEDDVYLLSLVLNSATQRTELRIYDGAELTGGAICRAVLPHVVPFGFHGNWLAAGFAGAAVN